MRRRNVSIGLLVVAVLACLWLVYCHVHGDYRRALFAGDDVFTGLVYFAEDHGGRLPTSEAEFRGCAFVENDPAGGVRIIARPGSQYRPKAYGVSIGDLASFSILWGRDLETLVVDSEGRVVDGTGGEIRLLRVPRRGGEWVSMSRSYSRQIYDICMELQARLRDGGAHKGTGQRGTE